MNSDAALTKDQPWWQAKVTPEQMRVAKALGISLVNGDSFLVASARIEDAVAEATGGAPCRRPTKRQRELSSEIDIDISTDSHRVAWAKIQEKTLQLYFEENMAALKNMQLVPGDTVVENIVIEIPGKEAKSFSREYTVSSIRWDGLVYFKGGNGGCSWASKLTKLANNEKGKHGSPP